MRNASPCRLKVRLLRELRPVGAEEIKGFCGEKFFDAETAALNTTFHADGAPYRRMFHDRLEQDVKKAGRRRRI